MKTARKWLALLLSTVMLLALLGGCGAGSNAPAASGSGTSSQELTLLEDDPVQSGEQTEDPSGEEAPDPDGVYTSAEDVALYLYTYGELPGNFITKKEAKALGWTGGSLEPYAPGMCIGGDHFGNYEGVLPEGDYHECDIDTLDQNGQSTRSRGAKRLVFSEDGRIYYTEDHYEHFELLYGEE